MTAGSYSIVIVSSQVDTKTCSSLKRGVKGPADMRTAAAASVKGSSFVGNAVEFDASSTERRTLIHYTSPPTAAIDDHSPPPLFEATQSTPKTTDVSSCGVTKIISFIVSSY